MKFLISVYIIYLQSYGRRQNTLWQRKFDNFFFHSSVGSGAILVVLSRKKFRHLVRGKKFMLRNVYLPQMSTNRNIKERPHTPIRPGMNSVNIYLPPVPKIHTQEPGEYISYSIRKVPFEKPPR